MRYMEYFILCTQPMKVHQSHSHVHCEDWGGQQRLVAVYPDTCISYLLIQEQLPQLEWCRNQIAQFLWGSPEALDSRAEAMALRCWRHVKAPLRQYLPSGSKQQCEADSRGFSCFSPLILAMAYFLKAAFSVTAGFSLNHMCQMQSKDNAQCFEFQIKNF